MAIGIPGINLPTQSMAGPVATGQAYAQQIAGGMPMEQVIAPGVSYSPEMAGGYTQADLDLQNRYVGEGPAPVMPVAPTKGTPLTIEDQMLFAPPGVQEPTKFMPFLQDLDFSGLPRYEEIKDVAGFESIRPTFIDPNIDFDLDEILKNIDTEKFEDIDLSGIDIPSVAPMMPTAPAFQQPITPIMPQVPVMPEVPVMPQVPTFKEPTPFVPEVQNIPMNFTGLPQMPVIPNIPVMPELPVMPQPIVQQPIQPMNFTRLSNLPVSNFVQPSVDEIVRPITRQGKFLPQTPRGLFSL